MAQPDVQVVAPTPAQPRQQLLITGTNFSFVNSAFFKRTDNNELYEAGFTQVFDGEHTLVTVPADIDTNFTFIVVLVTIEDEVSTFSATPFMIVPLDVAPPPPAVPVVPDPLPLPVPGNSVGLDRIRARTRLELADPAQPFQAKVTGDGLTTVYDLPVLRVRPSDLIVTKLAYGDEPEDAVVLTTPNDYVLDGFAGVLTLTAPLGDLADIYVTGTRYRFFDDDTLDILIETAFAQITHGRQQSTATINQFGYRQYGLFDITYDTLPEVEILPTALLAKIEAMWILATDASYDIDISEDGASIPRSERYRQLMGQIQADTARFHDIAQQLNIGLSRIEMDTLRRVSRQTGRLVPVYVEKEYDDHSLPVRVLPGIDQGQGEGTTFVDPYYQEGADFGGGYGP